MRLSKIRLAGFKSFVDPTTIHLPSNLVGVVGPNGCGKSNVIDAVRWVMGETSARHLRGDSMEDVIFNGSSSRKPVGTASIELTFDNADGTIGGQYASYAEISIRRVVSRDGTSQYFLNNTRCRRKDITGLFLGTGLGPRSYAIIEQGMVSRLVDARPDEMRVYIEEAAGISRYKERRRETETRMQHTRDNLSRLNDLRDEVEKQIKHLQRQAQVAERYRTLKQQERRLDAELLAMRLRALDEDLTALRSGLATRQTAMDGALAGQRQAEADVERARASHADASEAFSATQARYYGLQGEVARLEQSLAHQRELRARQQQDLEQSTVQHAALGEEITRDQAGLDALDAQLRELEPALRALQAQETASLQEVQRSEAALAEWQERWHTFNLEVREHQQARQVEQTRLEHLEAHRQRLNRQLDSMEGERRSIPIVDLEARLEAQRHLQADARAALARETAALAALADSLARLREQEQQAGAGIEAGRGELEAHRARLDTLRAIQDTALGNDEDRLAGWLDRQGLAGRARLIQRLGVDAPWSRAVETVLGDFLQGVCVEDPAAHTADLPDTTLVLVAGSWPAGGAIPPDSLAARVRDAGALLPALTRVRCAPDLDEALRIHPTLAAQDSVITPEGIWLGAGWVRVSRGQRYTGTIDREQELRELADAVRTREAAMTALGRRRDEARREIEVLEARRAETQHALTGANRASLEADGLATQLVQELDRTRQRAETLASDSDSVRGELGSVAGVIDEARTRLEAAEQALVELEARRPSFQREQEDLLTACNRSRQRAEQHRGAAGQARIDFESRRAAREGAATALERLVSQARQLQERMGLLGAEVARSDEPVAGIQQALDAQLASQLLVQQELAAQRGRLEEWEQAVAGGETRRLAFERQVATERETVDGLRMQVREDEVRREAFAERFAATGCALEEVLAQLTAEAQPEEWDQQLGRIRNSIERLGPINLAAIDEFSEQSERKTYLDAQYQDLSAALETLEHAIRKIDRETRTRFQETFDNINAGLKRIFPRLFGGGHAYLGMDGDDLLSAGVTVMARPPGKRNSHIHLLSGGEKALTAVALIFSIFELNPAPFCLLDEVDAPLDEANVGRFCDIVREMSKTVQFIVITHNKTTMEMARQLTGVTMNEPGVSRLVAVDIDEAVKLAAS